MVHTDGVTRGPHHELGSLSSTKQSNGAALSRTLLYNINCTSRIWTRGHSDSPDLVSFTLHLPRHPTPVFSAVLGYASSWRERKKANSDPWDDRFDIQMQVSNEMRLPFGFSHGGSHKKKMMGGGSASCGQGFKLCTSLSRKKGGDQGNKDTWTSHQQKWVWQFIQVPGKIKFARDESRNTIYVVI